MFPVSTNGIIEEKVITLKHAVLVVADEGKPVKVTAENTVALAADGVTEVVANGGQFGFG